MWLEAALEARILQRKRSVMSPPIKSRTTKLPIEAATTVIVLLGELVDALVDAEAVLLEAGVPLVGVEEVLLAMFISKISDGCILFA